MCRPARAAHVRDIIADIAPFFSQLPAPRNESLDEQNKFIEPLSRAHCQQFTAESYGWTEI